MLKDPRRDEPQPSDSSKPGDGKYVRQSGKPWSESAQLSTGRGVTADVGSIALERVVLVGASGQGTVEVPAELQGALADSQMLHMLSDAEVMLRVAGGDDTAFDYLVEKFRRPMISFMYRMTHNQAVAEELAQEVFLRVYRSRKGYAASAKFTTWLYRIATNLAVNHARDTKYERPENTVSIDEPDTETGMTVDLPDEGINAEQMILRRERMAAIRKQVDALPVRQRTAVLMHKYQNMDYKQIAEVLKLSESATKSLLFRAYEALRQSLKEFV